MTEKEKKQQQTDPESGDNPAERERISGKTQKEKKSRGQHDTKQEIDWVEEREGSLFGYEFKWNESKVKIPTQWKNAYPNASFEVINKDNFSAWLK